MMKNYGQKTSDGKTDINLLKNSEKLKKYYILVCCKSWPKNK